MRKYRYLYSSIVGCILLVGCATEATQNRLTIAEADVGMCQQRVLDTQVKLANTRAVNKRPQVMFKDERNAMTYLMVEKMAEMNAAMVDALTSKDVGIEACDDVIIAMVNAEAQRVSGTLGIVKTGVGMALGLVGVKLLVDGVTELANPEGAVTGDTYNINGSRVVSNSGNGNNGGGYGSISASGEGAIFGNSMNRDGIQQGGIQPRGNQTTVKGDIVGFQPGSNSGTNGAANGTSVTEPTPMPTPTPVPQ